MEVEMVEPIEPMEIDDEFVEMFCKPDLDFESKIVETQLSKHSKTKDVNNTKSDTTIENNNFDGVNRNFEEEKLTLRAKRFNLDTINNNNYNQSSALKSEDLYLRFQQLANKHGNKRQTFFTGIDIFSEEETRKKEQRAKRFGLNNKLQKKDDLYHSLGIDEKSESFKNLRLDTVHMRGTNDMTTEDVFEYFKCYTPSAIEWINDESCNVVWLDAITAARALKGLSTKILGLDAHEHDRHVSLDQGGLNEQFENENGIHVKDINHQIPPGYWRKGVDYGLHSRSVLLRFATDSDKKTSYLDRVNRNKESSTANNYNNIHPSQRTKKKRQWTDLDDVDQGNAYYKRIAHNKVVYNNFDDDENEDDETDDYVSYKRQPKLKRSLNMKDRLGYTTNHQDWSNVEHHDSESCTMPNKNSRFLSKDDLRHKISNQSKSQLNYYD